MRRRSWRYALVLAAVCALTLAFVLVVWSRGEDAHASLHTAAKAPAALPLAAPDKQPVRAWHTSDRLAIGPSASAGTVVTYSAHVVSGRDGRTGRQAWRYTRTDRTVCSVVVIGDTTIALYVHDGSCDEISAFATGTGTRRWTRTLDKDGMPFNGRPVSYGWTDDYFLVASRSVIYTLWIVNGQDQWTYSRYGCRIGRAVFGTAGALFTQTCTRPQCNGKTLCRSGPQLVLRDGTKGNDDKPGGDYFRWALPGNTDIPVSAGPVVTAFDPTTRNLDLFTAGNGGSGGSVRLSPAPASTGSAMTAALDASVAVDLDQAELVWLAGRSYVFDATTAGPPLWTRATLAAPTVVSPSGLAPVGLGSARITVPTAGGAQILDGNSGAAVVDVGLPGPAASRTVVLPLGAGLLTAGSGGTTAYR